MKKEKYYVHNIKVVHIQCTIYIFAYTFLARCYVWLLRYTRYCTVYMFEGQSKHRYSSRGLKHVHCTHENSGLEKIYRIAGKFGGLASVSENKYWQILIWQMAEFDLAMPRISRMLEIVDGSGLLVRSSAGYGGIIVFGLQPSVRDYPALKEKSKTSLKGSVQDRSDSSK